jgi:hypothetical protein
VRRRYNSRRSKHWRSVFAVPRPSAAAGDNGGVTARHEISSTAGRYRSVFFARPRASKLNNGGSIGAAAVSASARPDDNVVLKHEVSLIIGVNEARLAPTLSGGSHLARRLVGACGRSRVPPAWWRRNESAPYGGKELPAAGIRRRGMAWRSRSTISLINSDGGGGREIIIWHQSYRHQPQ